MSISPSSFDWVRQLVHRESAIALEPGKEYLVESRLTMLARAAGHPDVDAYVLSVQRNPTRSVTDAVVDALTTNETSFFRDVAPWTALTTTVVPDVVRSRQHDRRMRVWSAACSSGQEPYTISMLLSESLPSQGWSYEIVATDLSEEMLTKARAGRFSQLEINRGLPATLLVKHFTREGTSWAVTEAVKRPVEFRRLNLAAPFPALGRFDVVFLRNVLIYFDTPTKRAVLAKVRSVLAPHGYLFLGGAETTLGVDDAWERVEMGRTSVYRPKAAGSPRAETARIPVGLSRGRL